MALTQLIASIRSDFNVSTQYFAAQVADWFAAHPGIIVQAVDWNRPDSTYTAGEQVLRISYLQAAGASAGGTWQAFYYQSDGSASAQAQFTSAFTPSNTPSMLPVFVVDITDHERARTGADSLLVIGLRTDVGPLGLFGYDRGALIAQPIALIAASATGNAILYDASGRTVSASFPVRNVGTTSWVAGERNYVVYDELTGLYIGLPSCAGATAWVAPAATTTTPYTGPTYFAQPIPTTSPDQPTTPP